MFRFIMKRIVFPFQKLRTVLSKQQEVNGATSHLSTVVKFMTSVPLLTIVGLGVQQQEFSKANGETVKVKESL